MPHLEAGFGHYGQVALVYSAISFAACVLMILNLCQHLFFECNYVALIWPDVSRLVNVQRTIGRFQEEVNYAMRRARNSKNKMYVMLFSEASVYAIRKQ